MDDSSSEGSADEEEMFRNFDQEAKIIVQSETLPKKSSDRYLLVYNTYKKWQEENKNALSRSEENNLIVYFKGLQAKLKPPTLWSIWSMLRKTLSANENINIANYLNLKSIIKSNAKGYKPKKAFVLRWPEILEFMNTAPDTYLDTKVILVFGICGCLRCDEIANLKVEDVEDLGNKRYMVSVGENKNDYSGRFMIGSLFYDTVKKYISLRPPDQFSDRFFIQYREGRCVRQPIGRHKIGEVPEKIASYLKLPNSKKYTGHCFRRTSATLLSDSGANMQMIKQLGRWRSDLIAQGYVENSFHNRQLIFDGVVQNTKANTHPKPSTSAQVPMECDNESFDNDIQWSDFDEEFPLPCETVESGFNTANDKPILIPVKNQNEPRSNKSFLNKSPIKLKFRDQPIFESPSWKKRKSIEDLDIHNQHNTNSTLDINKNERDSREPLIDKPRRKISSDKQTIVQPSSSGKRESYEVLDNQHYDDMNSVLKKHNVKFDNCTITNCTFNMSPCYCNKENK